MPAYRFCRPDDIPLLVSAVRDCFESHFPGMAPLTVDDLRREMRQLDVWPSNSMVALGGEGGGEPLAVMIGTKREREVLVRRIGVRSGHQRRGHGSHLLSSLSQKLAVLGPERLVAEVPADDPAALALFIAAGYAPEGELVDWRRPAPGPDTGSGPPVPDELVIPVTVADLAGAGVLPEAADDGSAWERRRRTLEQSADELAGAAIATPERLEAWLLWRRDGSPTVDLLAAGCRDPQRAELLLGLLSRWLAHRSAGALRLVKLNPGELPLAALAANGFVVERRYQRLAARAVPL